MRTKWTRGEEGCSGPTRGVAVVDNSVIVSAVVDLSVLVSKVATNI